MPKVGAVAGAWKSVQSDDRAKFDKLKSHQLKFHFCKKIEIDFFVTCWWIDSRALSAAVQ